jgi:hypothetical protein
VSRQEREAAAKLWSMAHLGTPMAIRVAATLRLADHIAAGVTSPTALAETTGTDPDALARLLRYLADRGVFERDASGRYALTALGTALRADHPGGQRAGLDIENIIGRAELAFVELLHSVRTGEPAFPVHFGHSFWDDLDAAPDRKQAFNERMAVEVAERVEAVRHCYDWGSLGHLVDVGGGNGSLLTALLVAHPRLRGTVVDQAGTVDAARATMAAAGVADRGDAVAGDFFAPLPVAGAGAYLLSLVIHDWADEPSVSILRRCAEAAGPGGSVFVLEKIGADGESPHSGMDLRMLVYYGGKERGVVELSELAEKAGLATVAVHPAGGYALLELKAA